MDKTGYAYGIDIHLKKILPDSSLRNKDLSRRSDLTPLLRTACHRYNYDGVDVFAAWFLMLNQKEQMEVVKYLQMSPEYVLEIFHHESVTVTFEKNKRMKEIEKQIRNGL